MRAVTVPCGRSAASPATGLKVAVVWPAGIVTRSDSRAGGTKSPPASTIATATGRSAAGAALAVSVNAPAVPAASVSKRYPDAGAGAVSDTVGSAASSSSRVTVPPVAVRLSAVPEKPSTRSLRAESCVTHVDVPVWYNSCVSAMLQPDAPASLLSVPAFHWLVPKSSAVTTQYVVEPLSGVGAVGVNTRRLSPNPSV